MNRLYGVILMIDEISERVRSIAEHVSLSGETVRATAERFGVSKSTVHKDLAVRLKYIDGELYGKTQLILAKNRAERHIRGGNATKEKYSSKKERR
jgi:putative DeoR family transcriptional regulator (stage III sporulation protein D)